MANRPQALHELIAYENPNKVEAVMDAMTSMVKRDVAALEKACEDAQ